MNKRLLKRHKRQVARASSRAKETPPDVRTPEEIRAAREASRPIGGWRSGSTAGTAGSSIRSQAGPSASSRASGDE